ncbi:MAG: LolA family protein [Solirubrobacteraceae bacterium]
MNPLRRLPTRKLLALIAGVIVLAGSISAVAVAALTGGGPVPAAKSLAAAIHDALLGPKIEGITANIQFTNNLIDSSSIPNSTPLLKGASGRLWASNDGRLRLELQSSRGDTEVMIAPGSFSVFDVAGNTVYRGTLPAHKASAGAEPAHQPPTLKTITDAINSVMAKVGVSKANPTDIGGAPAYSITFSPKHDGGLLGKAELAFDSVNGAPLRFAVYAQGNPSPVLELTATNVSFGAVASGDLTVAPPSNAKIVEISQPSGPVGAAKAHKGTAAKETTGATRVAAALPFRLDAPAKLAGLPQTSVRLLSFGKQPAAVVTYGQHLGAIVVIERQADPAKAGKPAGGSSESSPLPTVSINGATGTELATALGTGLMFDRAGVSYIVLGSVPPAAAEAAARGL